MGLLTKCNDINVVHAANNLLGAFVSPTPVFGTAYSRANLYKIKHHYKNNDYF